MTPKPLTPDLAAALEATEAAGDSFSVTKPNDTHVYYVVDGELYQQAMKALRHQQNVASIRKGVESIEAGRGMPLEESQRRTEEAIRKHSSQVSFNIIIEELVHVAIERNALWWADRYSAEEAYEWERAIYDQLRELKVMPARCGLARENGEFPFELRQKLLGTGGRLTFDADAGHRPHGQFVQSDSGFPDFCCQDPEPLRCDRPPAIRQEP